MKVRTRLLLFGAALPMVALAATVLLAGQVFRLSLLRALDRALLAQAAVESASLFDSQPARPNGGPHLHLSSSPIRDAVRSFAPTVALFAEGGKVVALTPEGGAPPRMPAPGELGDVGTPPRLTTRSWEGGRSTRELAMRVRSPEGARYTLVLEASLADLERTVGTYYQATLGLCAFAALALLGAQWWQAERMSRRLREMTDDLPRLKGGDLTWRLPADATGDEIAALRAALEDAMGRLRAAREAEERLIANAAHELRTPLGLMRTEMDLALRRERPAEELRRALEEARREVDRLAALAARLLDLAALGGTAFTPAPGDLGQLLRAAVEACEAAAEQRGVRVAVAAPEQAPSEFDETMLRQALDNYLANALRFAPAGTTISVALSEDAPFFRITVSDEGPGVPASDAEKVFEPFFRASKQGNGAGLGLSIVREIAKKHGGRAYVAKGAAKGATFALELPRR